MKATLSLCVLLLTTTTAVADLSYTANFDNRTGIPALPGFNPALGALERVTLDITGKDTGFWFTIGPPITSGTFNMSVEAVLGRSYVGGDFQQKPFVFDTPLSMFLWSADFACSSVITTDLQRFETPQINLSLDVMAFFSGTTSPVVGSRSLLTGTETITYAYANPEPSSLVIAGLGALLIGVWWRS